MSSAFRQPSLMSSTFISSSRELLALLLLAFVLASTSFAQSAATTTAMRVESDSETGGWRVYAGDELFAGFIPNHGTKPIVYPIIGPSGHAVTRNFPMKMNVENERDDHDHQRSMWLTHGEVNGIDFWIDDEDKGCGKIVQTSGSADVDTEKSTVIITTENDWLGPDGKRILSDQRRFAFFEDAGRRVIDCDFLLKATDGDVNFGDTKEGSFGIRVAGTMKVEAKMGGIITNAEGQQDKDAWGLKSAWVDYSGPVDGDTVGITIHDHPSSFGFPCRWHVRTYGLFAANPFGQSHFIGGEKTKGIVLQNGKQMRLNYRVVIHDGGLDADQATEDSKQYAGEPRPNMQSAR